MAPIRSDGNNRGNGSADGGGIPLGVYGIVGKEIPAGAKGSGTIAQRRFYKEPKPKVERKSRRRRRG